MPGSTASRRRGGSSQDPTTPGLILTTFDLDEYAFDGLQAGASGFLLKDVRPASCTMPSTRSPAGDAVVSPRITRDLVDHYAGSVRPAGVRVPPAVLETLTPREREVFEVVSSGLSNAEIADRLHLTEATVKTHITRVLAKLDLRDRVQVVVFAYEHGLR